MSALHLIVTGPYKNPHYQEIEAIFLKRINLFKLSIHEIKASALGPQKEGEILCEKVKKISPKDAHQLVLLDEKGEDFNSQTFSHWLNATLGLASQKLIFAVGGAHGFSRQTRGLAHKIISLSKLTFPHRLVRLIFIEQLYRAQCIIAGHPYHHE